MIIELSSWVQLNLKSTNL